MTIFDKLLDRRDPLEENADLGNSETQNNQFFFCLNSKRYFDIEEEDITQRVLSALTLKPPFQAVVSDKPDLYGPFWIASSLIVIIVASSSLIMLFAEDSTKNYDFEQISVAAGLIYGISFGCPYIIAIVLKCMGSTVSVVKLICIYGYSLTIFLPITMLCFINNEWLQLGLLLIGYCMSTVFLIRGIFSMDRELREKEKFALGVFILGVQLLLVLMYKFYFFKLL